MPYTIEILALEFNRTKEQIENAMKVFCDLNMVCVDENGVFSKDKRENHDKSKDEVKNNKSKINILDISNNNLVNDKNVQKKDNKKKSKNSSTDKILTYDDDNLDEEVIYFDDSNTMPEGKTIAIFNYA